MELLHGVDLERISRFDSLVLKAHFLERVYTADELACIRESRQPSKKAAALFSAKESISKALGRGLYGLLPNELEIGHDKNGRPQVVLHGGALEEYGAYAFSLSISYKDDYVMTSCIAYRA